jgi:hypothetical protein
VPGLVDKRERDEDRDAADTDLAGYPADLNARHPISSRILDIRPDFPTSKKPVIMKIPFFKFNQINFFLKEFRI